jgi:tetratricopeptide (TPR) repeat protein
MRIGGRRPWLALLLLLLIGFALYRIGLLLWCSYHYRAALAALERRDFQQADLHLQRSLDAAPGDLTVRLVAARTARRQRHYDSARKHLDLFARQQGVREALALEQHLRDVQEGDLSDVDRLLAFCAENHDVPESPLILEACIEGMLKGGPPLIHGMSQAAAATSDVARVQRAVDSWLRARPHAADQVQGRVWRGRAYALANDQPKALSSLHEALELDPGHFEARLYLALYLAEGAPGEAAAHLRVLRDRFPESKSVRIALATVLRNLGRPAEARQILDEVLADQSAAVIVLLERGRVALDLQDPGDAERWLRRAWTLAPDQREVNLALSACLRMAGKTAEAKVYQDRFEEIDAEARRKQSAAAPKQ